MKIKEVVPVAIAFLLTFICGLVIGMFISPMLFSPFPGIRPIYMSRSEMHKNALERMQERLKLSPDQRQKIEAILIKYQKEIAKTMDPVRPNIHPILKRMTTEIDSVLTPEQREIHRKEFLPMPGGRERFRDFPGNRMPGPGPKEGGPGNDGPPAFPPLEDTEHAPKE
ncbi:MAG: LTXXQ motif protein [bacterium ADurb.Bin478]|nr:MAG: LTXXQ motif protein [bacterium ADurb.Bin478]